MPWGVAGASRQIAPALVCYTCTSSTMTVVLMMSIIHTAQGLLFLHVFKFGQGTQECHDTLCLPQLHVWQSEPDFTIIQQEAQPRNCACVVSFYMEHCGAPGSWFHRVAADAPHQHSLLCSLAYVMQKAYIRKI